MLQKQFSKLLDNISYAYMGTQKKHGSHIFHTENLKEYIESHDITDPMDFFANNGVVPDVKVTKTSTRMNYVIKQFQFESSVETPHRVNNTVHGVRYILKDNPTAPTFVVLHGWQMESYTFFDYYSRMLAKNGFNSVLIDLPYHMHRRAPKSHHGEFTFTDDAVLTIKVMKQSVSDVQAAINWLKSEGIEKIGTFGVSYGGMLAGLTGCVDPSVDFMMLIVPPADLYDFFTNTRLGKEFRQRNPHMFEEVQENRELFERISIVNLKPQMKPENIFIVVAEYDGMVSAEAIDRLWRSWERPHLERYVQGHLSVVLFNPSLTRHARRWLKTLK